MLARLICRLCGHRFQLIARNTYECERCRHVLALSKGRR